MKLSKEELNWFYKNYEDYTQNEIMEILNCSKWTVFDTASKLGLSKKLNEPNKRYLELLTHFRDIGYDNVGEARADLGLIKFEQIIKQI